MAASNNKKDAKKNILILGNLQSGKTTLVKGLCGGNALEADTPQTSVSLNRGELDGPGASGVFLTDTPGTTTLLPQGEDDELVLSAILREKPDALLLVADAKNLRRSLALVAHAAEFQIPMVLAVNMEDEAWQKGIRIDFGLLESLIGIDIVKTVATQKLGFKELKNKLKHPKMPRRLINIPWTMQVITDELTKRVAGLVAYSPGIVQLLAAKNLQAKNYFFQSLNQDELKIVEEIEARFGNGGGIPLEVEIAEALYLAAGKLSEQVITQKAKENRLLVEIGRMAHHPIYGLIIATFVIYVTYLWIGELGATIVVDWFSSAVFSKTLLPWVESWTRLIPVEFLRAALVDPNFGLVNTGLFLAFGLVMPVLVFFYFAFNMLVTSGYLARLSILLDRVFKVVGLNGKGILPLAMGLSCVTMALITTRVLDSKKERLIASFLLLLGTPCAPLLAAMLVVLGPMPFFATVVVFGTIISQTIIAGILFNRIIKGKRSDFIMEIPPMRIPRITMVVRQTFFQTYYFMKEALPFFLLASFAMLVIDRLGGLDILEAAAHPISNGLLGLPDESVHVFIKTIIRREAGAAELGLVRSSFNNAQLVVTLVVMTFLSPCVNSIIVAIKERGLRDALLLLATVSTYALVLGTTLNAALRFFNISF